MAPGKMKGASHINMAMVEDRGSDGSCKQEQKKKPCGSTVSFHSLQYKVQVKSAPFCTCKTSSRQILHELNGVMKPGLNAILGPTGSGKSSFLDILAARKDPAGLSGEVLIDGAPQPPNFKCISGYVVQDDVVMGTLTVKENLRFSAALRLPTSVPQSEKETRINLLIKELGLTKVADTTVGSPLSRGISGGERKRTSIGMEMIIDPSVLFLDEPTSGLDSSTASSVLLLLKRMAGQGKTIIMSIHQPRYSIYRLFDSLTLLVSGKMVYHGPAPNALDYFANIGYLCEPHNNPADFLLDVLNGDSTATAMIKLQGSEELDFEEMSRSKQSIEEHLLEEYRNSSYFTDTQSELERIVQGKSCPSRALSHSVDYNSPFLHQLQWVMKRTFQNLALNPQTSVAQLAINMVLAFIVGVIYFSVQNDMSGIQNRMGALFFITTNECFLSVSSAELLIVERKTFVHEYISGYYRVSVYFLSKVSAELITRLTISVVISCIVYFMIGFKSTVEAFFIFTLTIILVGCTASALALAIAAGQRTVAVSSLLLTLIFIFMMIFSGLLVNLPSLGFLSWLQYFSIPRYGLAALEINEFVGLKFCDEDLIKTMATTWMNSTASQTGLMCTGEQYLDHQGGFIAQK
ncbi:broad substrate specificity ATP-binding cassette transporter ABCG2d isoform X1 [Boleophthalmus pectinirostris]|uniref:broad substrate specificity ATP-binding cassette transporter ABCG2d isoform X1 n=1 Tax=Boleophthalmus pectinirostris TaxID=150288 RepID=UPI0024315522|nr:broad substrate specificity ATP-binding cassette transporter ABCG2d isoform X1 [Boleophthalmus pectinirostris]